MQTLINLADCGTAPEDCSYLLGYRVKPDLFGADIVKIWQKRFIWSTASISD